LRAWLGPAPHAACSDGCFNLCAFKLRGEGRALLPL
jgi:hypothetical protein